MPPGWAFGLSIFPLCSVPSLTLVVTVLVNGVYRAEPQGRQIGFSLWETFLELLSCFWIWVLGAKVLVLCLKKKCSLGELSLSVGVAESEVQTKPDVQASTLGCSAFFPQPSTWYPDLERTSCLCVLWNPEVFMFLTETCRIGASIYLPSQGVPHFASKPPRFFHSRMLRVLICSHWLSVWMLWCCSWQSSLGTLMMWQGHLARLFYVAVLNEDLIFAHFEGGQKLLGSLS